MIIGHQRIIQYLSRSTALKNLSHAYLFSGPESIGKMMIAMEFAKFLQCPNAKNGRQPFNYCGRCKNCYDMDIKSHPDFTIFPSAAFEENEIKIGQIRDLIRIFSFKNYSAPYKIAIIDNADQMTNEAANALLKTLEEPSDNSILILISSRSESLLPTIVSRCQQIKFFSVPYYDLEKGLLSYFNGDSSVLADITEAARLSSGRPGIAVKIIQNPSFKGKKEENCRTFLELNNFSLNSRYQYVSLMLAKENEVADILNNWLYILKDIICLHFGAQHFILNIRIKNQLENLREKYSLKKAMALMNEIKETIFILRTTNVNKKLALENLMLAL
ncbi:MAG: DNA polymerase III subunit delta' [Patescibacteria group bacterium]